MTPRQPGRRVPSKSHGLRGPGPSGRPPRDAASTPPASPDGTPAATPASGSTSGDATAFGAPTVRPGSRAANRAAKRATTPTGVWPKTQVRRKSSTPSRGSSQGLILLGVIAVIVVAAVVIIGNPFGSATASPTPGEPVVYGDGTCPTSQPASLKAGDIYTVTVKTELGDIVMKIDGALAPIATGNFVALAKCHYYDGVVFHRLVPGFVIQGGDPDGTGAGPGPGYTITDDPLTTTYHRATVAMARTGDPNSQGSQFFIVLDDSANDALTSAQVKYPYAILGEVVSGMDVVDQIAAMENSGPPNNAAVDPIAMDSVTAVLGAPPTAAPTTAPTTAPVSPSAAPAS